jgi:hypothetical protein
MSARAELARRILEYIAHGNLVSFNDAFQLRNWAISPEDALLPLTEIARRILDHDDDAPKADDWRRAGAEFIITDLGLAFTFLEIARTSRVTATVRRNQKNARTAYDAVLRFLPRSLPALSTSERKSIEEKLRELKNRLEQLGENFKDSN